MQLLALENTDRCLRREGAGVVRAQHPGPVGQQGLEQRQGPPGVAGAAREGGDVVAGGERGGVLGAPVLDSVGVPVAVTVKVPAAPTVKVAALALVMAGSEPGWPGTCSLRFPKRAPCDGARLGR